jgi:two-component system sensor histidine kinase YesM
MRKHWNLFTKLNVAFISTGLLPVLLISMYLSQRFQTGTFGMMQDNYGQIVAYGVQNIDNMIERYNDISKTLYSYNPESGLTSAASDGAGLARILKSGKHGELEQLKRKKDILAFIQLVCKSDSYIRSVAFIERDGSCHVYVRSNRYLASNALMIERYRHENALESKNKLFVIPTHSDNYYSGGSHQVFSVGRNYIDLSMGVASAEILGTLYIDVDIGAIDNLFSGMEIYQAAEILVMDKDGNLTYANRRYYSVHEDTSKRMGDMIEIGETCKNANWKLSLFVDYRHATKEITNLVRVIYIAVAVLLLALLSLSFFYSGVFSQPARNILQGMRQVEAGNFRTHVSVRKHDEMGWLADGFNYMTKQLDEYNQTSLLSQIKWKEAELIALRAQINPHFLYNNLEIIRMNAVANDDESTAELASLLAEQMRCTLGRIGETVSLKRELEITKSYFRFIDIRFDGGIAFELTLGNNLTDVQVPGLMIQPVVENAVVHGLKPKGSGHVGVSIERHGNDLVIRVMDDGIGMSEETVKGIIDRLDSDETNGAESNSLGLKNVHDRLRLKFGAPYGISVNSQLQIGTSVTVTMPLIKGEREDA